MSDYRYVRRETLVSTLIGWLTWATVTVLVVGVFLVWRDADLGNSAVRTILDLDHRLATPFEHVFSGGSDPKAYLYETWALAGVVYLIAGGILNRLTRW